MLTRTPVLLCGYAVRSRLPPITISWLVNAHIHLASFWTLLSTLFGDGVLPNGVLFFIWWHCVPSLAQKSGVRTQFGDDCKAGRVFWCIVRVKWRTDPCQYLMQIDYTICHHQQQRRQRQRRQWHPRLSEKAHFTQSARTRHHNGL